MLLNLSGLCQWVAVKPAAGECPLTRKSNVSCVPLTMSARRRGSGGAVWFSTSVPPPGSLPRTSGSSRNHASVGPRCAPGMERAPRNSKQSARCGAGCCCCFFYCTNRALDVDCRILSAPSVPTVTIPTVECLGQSEVWPLRVTQLPLKRSPACPTLRTLMKLSSPRS